MPDHGNIGQVVTDITNLGGLKIELIEMLLKEKGRWQGLIRHYDGNQAPLL